MPAPPSFAAYVESLSPFEPAKLDVDPHALALAERATAKVRAILPVTRASLARELAQDPEIAQVLAAVVGLSQERFKTWLKDRFGTAGWIRLSKQRSADLVDALDEEFGLVGALETDSGREWQWSDVLVRVMSPRQNAGASVRQGRAVEDAVEQVVSQLALPYQTRTRFTGKAGRSAPADFVVTDGDGEAAIAIAVKGFDSTGSKLSDAAREIEEMVQVKTPRQFVFAVVDGQGWKRRQSDLRRIHKLWTDRVVDGLFTRSQLGALAAELRAAARRLDLL